jgi:hypothetical protein
MATKTAHDADTLPPAMDYAMHERTYEGFIAFVKWAIIDVAFLLVALYCFIIADQPVLGLLLLAMTIVGVPFWAFVSSRR